MVRSFCFSAAKNHAGERAGRPMRQKAECPWSWEKSLASIAAGGALAARIGRAEALAGFRVYADGFDLADPDAARKNFVAALFEVICESVRECRFEEDFVGHPLLMKARGIDGLLRVHAKPRPVENGEKSSRNNA